MGTNKATEKDEYKDAKQNAEQDAEVPSLSDVCRSRRV
jgi:hypothetical protein